MKFLESSFENYISNVKQYNIHKKIEKYYELTPLNIEDLLNICFFGPEGSGKYSQSLFFLEKFSPTCLKYEKKISIFINKDLSQEFKISDIHYEIDFELLGCNSKIIWHAFYLNVCDIISTKKNKTGVIMCKNFHKIDKELLDIFYSYLQKNTLGLKIIFLILTEQVTFIPNSIYNTFKIINIPCINKSSINKIKNNKKLNINHVNNLKCFKLNINTNNLIYHYSDLIYDFIIQDYIIITENLNELRCLLYNLLIYNLNFYTCVSYILKRLIIENKLKTFNNNTFDQIFYLFKYYNNNYRPIYHLENFILYLIIQIHEL